MSADTFAHGEAELAEALGVAPALLQAARKKMRATEWGPGTNGAIAYTDAALPALVKLVTGEKMSVSELGVLLEKIRAASPAPVPARVWRLFRNPRVIEVRLPDETLVNIRVRHTTTLRAGEQGTVLQVQKNADGGYELAQRLPRTLRRGLQQA